jgi:hypothetical protein
MKNSRISLRAIRAHFSNGPSVIEIANGTAGVGAKPKASALPVATVPASTSSSSIGSSRSRWH